MLIAALSGNVVSAQEQRPIEPGILDIQTNSTVHPEERADSYIMFTPRTPTVLYSEKAQELDGEIEVIWGLRPEQIVIPAQIMIHPLEVGKTVRMYLVQFKDLDIFYPIFIGDIK